MRMGLHVVKTIVPMIVVASCGLATVAQADDKTGAKPATAAPATATAPAASEGRAILERAANAAKALHAVTYTVDTKTVGGLLESNNPPARAAVKALRATNPGAGVGGWLVHVSGSSTAGDTSKPFDVVWKASSIEVIDHDKKVLMERGGKSVMAPGVNIANRARLNDVLALAPYQQALRATTIEVQGTEKLDGVDCDMIAAIAETQTIKFAIAKGDSFPRKIEMVLNNPSVQSTITTLITGVGLETDASKITIAKEDDFKLSLPEGFSEDRQVAASQPRPAGAPAVATPKPEAMTPTERTPETKPTEKPAEKPAEQPADKPSEKPTEKPRAQAPTPGSDFTLKTSAGADFRLADVQGKVAVVQFFGSWCLPCREWHGTLNDAVEAGKDGKDVPMLAISTHERESKNATNELAKGDWRYLHLVEGDSVASQWNVTTYPATFVLTADGSVQRSWQGPATETAASEVTQAVREALAASQRVAGK